MEYWWSMLSCDCIIPIIMILYGRMMWKHYPNKINNYTGYRTKRSMKMRIHGNLRMKPVVSYGGY